MSRQRHMIDRMVRNKQIGVRVPEELLTRCDAVAARVPGFTRGVVVRLALEAGLDQLEIDPRYAPREGGKKRR